MSAIQIVLIAAAVIYVIAQRFAGTPVGGRSMIIPLGLAGYGLLHLQHDIAGTASGTLLIIEALIGLAAGAARAYTIKLFERDGHLWQKYTPLTLVVWIAMIGVRIGIAAAGHLMGVNLPSGSTLMFTFGLSLVAESLLVAKRAAATGTPVMPRDDAKRARTSVRDSRGGRVGRLG